MQTIRRKLVLGTALATSFLPLNQAVAHIKPAQTAPVKIAMIEALSGVFANTGEAVFRNLVWACERVNADGGIAMGSARRPLQLLRFDSKGQTEEALSALRAAIDDGVQIITQGNSSAIAGALIDAINKHNVREPGKQVVFLNYSAVDPALTNDKCSPWHFRFDAHADMRMAALMQVLQGDSAVQSVYLIGQDYSFGQAVLREASRQLAVQRPDIALVGQDLHPLGRVKDFAPYMAKIKASGAQAVITGNWGNDLSLLIKAGKEAGFDGKFYTFYGNALGAPAAIGEAGVGKVLAVAEWLPNVAGEPSHAFYQSFKRRFPKPEDDYVHLRMQMMVQALAQALGVSARPDGTINLIAVCAALAGVSTTLAGQTGTMRAADHQFQQPLVVGIMDKLGSPGVRFDVEGSGYGFRVIRTIAANHAQMPTTCNMVRS